MFRIGQRVVCVDGSPGRWTRQRLNKGGVYTIRGFDHEGGETGIYLEEVSCPVIPPWKQEMSWRMSRFRPAVEGKTSTGFSILEEIRKRESVPAEPRWVVTAGERSDG